MKTGRKTILAMILVIIAVTPLLTRSFGKNTNSLNSLTRESSPVTLQAEKRVYVEQGDKYRLNVTVWGDSSLFVYSKVLKVNFYCNSSAIILENPEKRFWYLSDLRPGAGYGIFWDLNISDDVPLCPIDVGIVARENGTISSFRVQKIITFYIGEKEDNFVRNISILALIISIFSLLISVFSLKKGRKEREIQ